MIRPEPSAPSLVLLLKAPQRSKRRLAAGLGDAAAAEVARRLAACALEDLAAWPGPTWLAPASLEDLEGLGTDAGHGVLLQGEGNLGARIARVAEQLHMRGYEEQIYIGIDCPTLNEAYLRRAAHALRTHEVVLGPAADGGVVLMGTRGAWPPLAALPWSTARLGAALAATCRAAGRRVATLDARADVDTTADLAPLRGALAHDGRPARRALSEWLGRLDPAPPHSV